MLTKALEVMKYIKASAGRAGLSVVWEDVNHPRHDGNVIYLPKITVSTSEEQLKQLMSSVDHEVAHDKYSDFDILKEVKPDPSGITHFVWNFLEDSRINAIEAREYRGFRNNWDETASTLVDNILSKRKEETDLLSALCCGLLGWGGCINHGLFPTIDFVCSKHDCSNSSTIRDVLNNFTDKLIACQKILSKIEGTRATYDLAIEILTALGVEGDVKREVKKSLADGEGSESKEKGSPKEELLESQEKEQEEYKIVTIKLSEKDLEECSVTIPKDGKRMGKVGVNFDLTELVDGGKWDLTNFDDFIVVDYPNKIGHSTYFKCHGSVWFLTEYENFVGSKIISQENFAQQVRRLIQIRAKVQTQYGVKKGKLDQSRISRVCFNAPGLNERVFKNKIENKTLDAAVTVLIDMSGSMCGKKAHNALGSALLMYEVCSTLNIPLEILGFTDADNIARPVPLLFIYKGFNTLKVPIETFKQSFASSTHFMCGNPDGENILWAYDRLVKRKEKKKLLIVMSDGSPAASKGSRGLIKFTEEVIKEIEQGGKVNIYGLGLCSPAVEQFYKRHSVVDSPEQIPHKLLDLFEREIINHV